MRAPPRLVGVYVHFPWCLRKCPYCDFVSYATERPAIDHARYADAVLAELDARRPALACYDRLSSIFVGGGTPSLWSPTELGRVLSAVLGAFGAKRGDVEITAECNPSSLDATTACGLVEAGINRFSVGVQGLDDERLRFLGRLHGADGAREAIRVALRSGVARVSGDLIYAVAGQPPDVAAREAAELADLGLRHVSAYALTIEPGTQFGELARRGRLPLADDGQMVESFFAVDEALASRGLRHYELSNFAVPGEESQHNLGYWRGHDYVGLGCAAYGTLARTDGEVVRYRNLPEPRRYMDAALAHRDVVLTTEPLPSETRLRERIMLGLRLAEGLDLAEAARDVGAEPWTRERSVAVERLVARGRLLRDGDRLRVPREAWIWTDETAASLF